ERVATALQHAEWQVDYEGVEKFAIRALRGVLPMYVKGFPGAAQIRAALYRADSIAEVRAALAGLSPLVAA
ncbi:MAG: tRNA dihydrouridine synthase DusB, partial [Armatimonadota bacterium]